MKRAGQRITLLMILSFALLVWGCGAATGNDNPQTGGGEEPTTQEQEPAPQEQPSASVAMAALSDANADDVALVKGAYGCADVASVDALAKAFIAGEYDFALVTPEAASALYNATSGSVLAIDAVCGDDGAPRTVTVVSTAAFTQDPETVVGYVSSHQELINNAMGEGHFLRGSAMQRALTAAISEVYVTDPSRVGGELPPDNFYFLG